MILGDVLAVVAALLGIYLTLWALVLGCGLLFETRAEAAREHLEHAPGKCIGTGAAVTFTLGLLGFIFFVQPAPAARFFGLMVILSLLAVAVVGAAGLSRMVAARITDMSPEVHGWAAFTRGAAIVVAGGLFPILGWFGFGPVELLAALGSGWSTLRVARDQVEAVR